MLLVGTRIVVFFTEDSFREVDIGHGVCRKSRVA